MMVNQHLRLAILIPGLQEGDVAKAKELLKKETKETIDQVEQIRFIKSQRTPSGKLELSASKKSYRFSDYYRSSTKRQLNKRTS